MNYIYETCRYTHYEEYSILEGCWKPCTETWFHQYVTSNRNMFEMAYKDGKQYFNLKGLNYPDSVFYGLRRY